MRLINLFVLLIALPAYSASPYDIGLCAGVESDAERLSCYDKIVDQMDVPGMPDRSLMSGSTGNWQYESERSIIDNSINAYAALKSSNKVDGQWGRQVTPVLVMRCSEGELDSFVNWHQFLGSDQAQVTIRLGDEKPVTDFWPVSNDNKAVFMPVDPELMIQAIGMVDEIAMEVLPFNESARQVLFNTSGSKVVAMRVLSTCGKTWGRRQ